MPAKVVFLAEEFNQRLAKKVNQSQEMAGASSIRFEAACEDAAGNRVSPRVIAHILKRWYPELRVDGAYADRAFGD